MTTAIPTKEIIYDRETRDYAMYLDGELTGFARTYHQAEVTLDELVFELLNDDYADALAEDAMGTYNGRTDRDPGGPEPPGDDVPGPGDPLPPAVCEKCNRPRKHLTRYIYGWWCGTCISRYERHQNVQDRYGHGRRGY